MASSDHDSKTIVIVGITGTQGSSVAKAFVNQPGWKLRGVTRKPFSPAAVNWQKKDVEILYGDMDDPESLRKALHGATIVFGVTDFWQHLRDPKLQRQAVEKGEPINALAFKREVEQGCVLIHAVAATLPSLERFIFSTLSSARDASKGAINFNFHFDSKAEMLKRLREDYPELWAKTGLLTLGCYAGNWKLYKNGAWPTGESPFVKALIDLPPGTNLVGAGSLISWGEWCNIWGRVNSVKCTFERQNRQVIEDAAGFIGREIADMYQFFEEHGYCGIDEKDVVYPWDLPVKVKYTTMEEYMRSQAWSSVLHPGGEAVVAP